MKIKREHIARVLLGISGVLLLIFLWWHYSLGMIRYFDADEFAHMHWTAQILMGKRPYVDFLTFFPPGFAWFLSLSFLGNWGTVQPLLTARFLMFLLFAGTLGVSALLFWEQRKSLLWALLAVVFVSFLPMPFDKYMEIRPDLLATFVVLCATLVQVKWMRTGKKIYAIATGVLYSVSYLVLPKMVPNILAGVVIAIWYVLEGKRIRIKKDWQTIVVEIKPFAFGLISPVLIFLLWTLTLGDFSAVWYSLTALSIESNKISKYFIMMPDLFFYPNGIYYGQDGYSIGLYTNHVLWMVGLIFGVWRLCTPFLTVDRTKVKAEVLIAIQCFVQVIFFVLLVPLKHAQYLIPIGVFVGYYCADFVVSVWNKTEKRPIFQYLFAGAFLVGAIFLCQTFIQGNETKFGWTNRQDIEKLKKLYVTIPQGEYILDLDGKMLYGKDPYYACCIPFGQFAEFLSRPLPSLPDTLEKTGTKYINQGGLERITTLPWADQQYIQSTFVPLNGDKTVLVRKPI
jgi:hypothetical protein